MRRKNVKLSIFLWSVEQPLGRSSVKPCCAKVETLQAPRVLPACHHTYRYGVLLTKSEKTVVVQI